MIARACERIAEPASLARSLGFAATEKVVRAAVTFGVSIAVLRQLGPADNARLVNAVATATLFATIGKLGLDGVVMREVADRPAESSGVVWKFVLLRASASVLLAWLLLHFYARVLQSSSMTAASIVALLVIVQGADLGLVWCQGLKLLQFTSVAAIAVAMTSAAAKIALVVADARYVAFLAIALMEVVLTALVLNPTGLAASRRHPPAPSRTHSLTTLGEVGYAFATSVVVVCFFSFDAVVLPRLIPIEVAGRYLAAKSLVDGVTTIGASFSVALFPFLVAARNESETQLARVFEASLSIAAYLGIAIGIALILGYTLLIGRLLGGRYAGTEDAVVYLAAGIGLFLQGGVVDSHLTIGRRMSFIFKKGILALAMKAGAIVALRSYLTPSVIAALTIVCSYGATLLITYLAAPDVFSAQIRSLNPRRIAPSVRVILSLG